MVTAAPEIGAAVSQFPLVDQLPLGPSPFQVWEKANGEMNKRVKNETRFEKRIIKSHQMNNKGE